jgi:hypothetical protein
VSSALRGLAGLVAAGTLATGAATPAAAQVVQGYAEALFSSGNTIEQDKQTNLLDAPLQDVGPVANQSDPSGDPSMPGTSASQGAEVAIDVGGGAIALACGADDQVLGYGTIRSGTGRAHVQYDENLAVGSATLAPGTPVTIQVVYRIAFGTTSQDTLDPAVVASRNDQAASAVITLDTYLQDLGGGSMHHYDTWLDSFGGTPVGTGLLADPTQLGTLEVSSSVGGTVRLRFVLDGNASATATAFTPSGQVDPLFPEAATGLSLALVFGAASDPSGVSLTSSAAGTALPGPGNATPANASAHALPVTNGPPVTVPEPGGVGEALATAAGLAGVASARRRVGGRWAGDASPEP